MRCSRARRILARKASREISSSQERLLADHLHTCSECVELEAQLDLTWSVLGSHPLVEPSSDFLTRLKARLRAEEVKSPSSWSLRPAWRWQIAALAVCALIAAILITRSGPLGRDSAPADKIVNAVSDRDRSDEQFLQDLERTLQYSDADYLAAYDSWPGVVVPGQKAEPSKSTPTPKLRKKEPS